jgi:hypothetical protein
MIMSVEQPVEYLAGDTEVLGEKLPTDGLFTTKPK